MLTMACFQLILRKIQQIRNIAIICPSLNIKCLVLFSLFWRIYIKSNTSRKLWFSILRFLYLNLTFECWVPLIEVPKLPWQNTLEQLGYNNIHRIVCPNVSSLILVILYSFQGSNVHTIVNRLVYLLLRY